MSYSTWHNYGYGIRVDDIKEQSVERLQALLKLAPELDQKIRAWLSELDIAEPDWDDYMDFDQVYYLGLATILQQVIEEAEGLRLTACDDSSGATYARRHMAGYHCRHTGRLQWPRTAGRDLPACGRT